MVVPDRAAVHDHRHGQDRHMKTITLTPPPGNGLFAGVQVEAKRGDVWEVVGAAPAFRLDENRVMRPATTVGVTCKLEPGDDPQLRAGWLHEDAALGVIWADVRPGRR